MSARLEFAIEAAHRGAAVGLHYFGERVSSDLKSDGSPVTIADRESEQAIRAAIASTYPDDAILGEEFGESGAGPNRWLIDPIDGTKSFLCGVPLYATLLSYEEAGEPVVGVCVLPALGLTLAAEKGLGCTLNGEPCRVSQTAELADAVLSTGSIQSLERHGRMAGVRHLGPRCLAVRGWSDAYGHALVAMGRIESMIDPIVARYDISAMEVIVREAGGTFTDFKGRALPQKEAISSNGVLHSKLLEAFG